MLDRDQVPAGAAWLGAGEPPFVSSVCITAVYKAETLLLEKAQLISLCWVKEKKFPHSCGCRWWKVLFSSRLTCQVVHVCSEILRSAWHITLISASQRSGCVFPWWCINICWEVIVQQPDSCENPLWGWMKSLSLTPKRSRVKWCFLNIAGVIVNFEGKGTGREKCILLKNTHC